MTIGNSLLIGILGELERSEWIENEGLEMTWHEMKGNAMNEAMNEWMMNEWMNENEWKWKEKWEMKN